MAIQSFLSDNASPAHPAVLQALSDASRDHVTSYGDDPETARAVEAFQELFQRECGVYFAYNGTGANVAALRAMLRPWHGVICTEVSHINEDEGGAPEALGGFKLLTVSNADGLLRASHLAPFRQRHGFVHTSQPAVISITQSNEVGCIYHREHLRELGGAAREAGYLVHMDGARIANAAATVARTTGVSPREAMAQVCEGVDVLSFGATKNGLLFGEAVVFLRSSGKRLPAEDEFPYARKQTTQLHSKMRYIAVQFTRYLHDDLWFDNALHANRMAQKLAQGLDEIPGVSLSRKVEANGVFPVLPAQVIEPLQKEFPFYLWEADRQVIRLVASWDTEEALVDRFIRRCRELCDNRSEGF
jgi:threonine aldolase